MRIYNAQLTLPNACFNESCSQVSIEYANGEIDVKLPFCAFLDSEQFKSTAKELKEINAKIVLLDANPKLAISLAEAGNSVLLVGLQNWSQSEFAVLKNLNILSYSLKEMSIEGNAEVCDAIMSVVKDSSRFHIHIEESVFNSTGLTPRESLYFFHRIRLLKANKSISLNIPNLDDNVKAKLAVELF